MAKEAAVAAKADGNAAYAAGDLDLAVKEYTAALENWDEALELEVKPKAFSKGDCVVYCHKGFGRVESAFTVMDEYFLKDLGTDKPLWVGDAGGDLKRFSKADLQPVPQDLFDLRLAVAQNIAAVMIKREDYKQAIKWSDEALRMDGWSLKALLRKGAAMIKEEQAGPASNVLLAAQQIAPKDPEVKRLLREAEKLRAPGWVCANGCCGPWGIQNHMESVPTMNLNTLGKGSTAVTMGPMKFGPSTAGQRIVADDDADSDCSGCSDADCSKKESPVELTEPKTTETSAENAESAEESRVSTPPVQSPEPASAAPAVAEVAASSPSKEPVSKFQEARRPAEPEEAATPCLKRPAAEADSELSAPPSTCSAFAAVSATVALMAVAVYGLVGSLSAIKLS